MADLSAAMTFPATLSLLSNVFTERRERARAIGLWGAIGGVAIAMGPIVGGWLLEHFSWASIFIAMAPVAATAAIVAALTVPASKDPDAAAPDIGGLVLSSATMALLVFTVIEAPAYGWGAGRSLAGFAASAVLLAAFIVRERRAAHPMLDVRLFRNLRFSAASGAVTVSFFTLFGFIFLMTQYFQVVRGYGPFSTGVRLLPVALSVGAGSVAGTQLAVRTGTKLIVTIGLVAMAAFYGWVAATTSATLSYGVISVQMVLYGLGLGLTSAPATESIMGAISRTKAGVGSAVNDATRLIGGTLGVAVIGSVYASVYGSRLTATLPAALPGRAAAIAHQSVGAAYVGAGQIAALGHPVLGQALQHAAANAFLRGLTVSCIVAGAGAQVYVGGQSADKADYFHAVTNPTPYVLAFVLGLSFLLLRLAFRSLTIAAVSILLNLLSAGAAYGLLTLVFIHGAGAGIVGFQKVPAIDAWVPLFMFSVLFALSMDYQVFLMSRIKERYDQCGSTREAVAGGVASTARIITGAALIIVAVFAGFARGQLLQFQEMGFGVAVALILDATLIRLVILPSTLSLLGQRSWYLPRWLDWLPHLQVEPPKAPSSDEPAAAGAPSPA